MTSRAAVALALVGALPVGLAATAMLVSGVGDYLDPCHRWGADPPQPITVEADGPCASGSATEHTRLSYAEFLVAVAGGLLAGTSMAVVGVLRGATGWAVAGVGVLGAELAAMLLGAYYAGVLAVATLASFTLLLSAVGADVSS